MKKIFLSELSPEEFQSLLEQSLDKVIGASGLLNKPKEEMKYLSIKEVCGMLSVSKPTLSRWTRAGIIGPACRINRKIFYDKEKLLETISKGELKTIKYRRSEGL